MAYTAGIDCTRKAWATPGFFSMSTLASSTAPLVSETTFSRMGVSWRQGSHQEAHRSTTTGTVWDRSTTWAWNVASVTSAMSTAT